MRGVDSRAGWLRLVDAACRVFVLWALAGCASLQPVARADTASVIPGGAPTYSFAASQDKLPFEREVARAQLHYSPYSPRVWVEFYGGHSSGWLVGLGSFYPLDVRWQLKDGRQFILERIDVPRLMQEFSRSHRIELQHQRENRPRDSAGDYGPSFVIEVADRWLVLKWQITLNLTPVGQRFKPGGAAAHWALVREEHIIAALPGRLVEGLDFDVKREALAAGGGVNAR